MSPYLPLNLSPEVERDIERVLLLADRPVMRRPFAAAMVLDALPRACRFDEALCDRVRVYLSAYMHKSGLTHAGLEGAATGGDSQSFRPNQRGMRQEDAWSTSLQMYWQPSDYALVQLGALAYPDQTLPVGSWISFGYEYAQLDIGFREHWWSPLSDSSMLVSTNAKPMPGVTVSNYMPISRLGIQYEAFLARMGFTNDIALGREVTSGHPSIGGLLVSIEPAPGWSLGVSRLLQFGGGERHASFSDFLDAFFRPTQADNVSGPDEEQFGNQVAAITSRMIFPGRRPFSIYFEYAGEDGSRGEGYRLGNVALSAGIDIPYLWNRFDFTYEASEWQNSWYVNSVYPHGTSSRGNVIGHWGADNRADLNAVGAQSHMVRLRWAANFGGLFDARYRTLANENYFGVKYRRLHELSLNYSRPWNEVIAGVELAGGVDVFDQEFARIGAFVRFAPGEAVSWMAPRFLEPAQPAERLTTIFVDAGVNRTNLEFNASDKGPMPKSNVWTSGSHAGIGVRRMISRRNDLGVRVEFDDVDDRVLMGVRAIDYRYRIGEHLAFSGFLGAARYDAPTPAYGYYGGLGAQWRGVAPGFDLSLELRGSDKILRDRLLPEDPASVWGDMYYKFYGANLYVSYTF